MTALEGRRGVEPVVLLPKYVANKSEDSPRNIAPSPLASVLNGEQKQSFTVLEEANRVGKKIKIITIGAGVSAINFAHDIDTNPLNIELAIYEKNPEIGGTWILAYLKKLAEKYNLLKYVRLSHRIVGAWWQEETQEWLVKIQRGDNPEDVFEDRCNILVNASGVLNKWKWPNIKGRESFKGSMLHSANWDNSISLEGKTVAAIGSGSSAVQIVPNIRPVANQLKCFIRSASWVTAGFGSSFAGKDGGNFKYTEAQKKILAEDPEMSLRYRKNSESEISSRFRFILNGSQEQATARAFAESEMKRKLAPKPEIAEAIIPKDFAVGCRRPTPGNGYLEALCEDNVEVVLEGIAEITPNGIRTVDGKEHQVDVIVCATGFDVSWKPAYPTIGRGNKSLSEEWKDIPSTYLSITVPQFPNYLIFNGPFGPYGHGSFLPITEVILKYFIQMIEKMAYEHVTAFEPKVEAVVTFY
ncbi:hypothetical protein ACLOAV_002281 [Pseudogymnoascus australis]